MTNDFTFKTIRNHRPYYGAPIRRRNKARRIHFENLLVDMRPFAAETAPRLAA